MAVEKTSNDSPEAISDKIKELVFAGQLEALRDLMHQYHPADIADILDELPPEEALIIFEILSDDVASEVLDETGSLVRQELVEKVDDERLADLLEELPMDDAAEFLDELPDDTASRLLGLMEPEEADDVRELLSYEDETAGRLMTRDVASLRRNWTVAKALEYLRSLVIADRAETLHYLYVVDRNDVLIGVVPVREMLLNTADTLIDTIMVPEVITIPVTADQEELAEAVSRYDFVAMPVVDESNRLVGVVTVDDVLDILEEEATEDIQRLGGSEPLAQPYFTASLLEIFGKRLIWLLPLFAASLVTDTIVDSFEWLTTIFISLMIFVPVIIGTGGNAGSQTVATIIRAIAVGEVRFGDLGRAWRREVTIGLLLGFSLGLAGYIRARLFDTNPNIALVLALTLPLVVIWANSVATIVPIVADRLKIDPAVVSTPMITTIVDASGLFIYFILASQFLT